MSDSFSTSSWPTVWISKSEPLPESCLNCGMFTDYKKTTRFVQQQTTVGRPPVSAGVETLGCLLHLLGPVGWVLALILHSGKGLDETGPQTVTVKSRIKVPVCRLCAGQAAPKPVDGDPVRERYAFEVHPRFAERLLALRAAAEPEDVR